VQQTPQVKTRLVRAHGIAALVTLFVAITFGTLAATELLLPDMMRDAPWLSWGRVRYGHTQGILFGWLVNAFLAFLYHAVPVLTGRPVTSTRLGEWLFALWNFIVVIPGWILVLAGFSQPLEWAEFPLVIDGFVVLAIIMAAIQFLPPFFARGLEQLYVSSWYIIGGLVFTLFSYPMGNIVPELVPGARGAAFSGLWIHDAVGLYVTPMALSIVYFVIPAATRRPVFSHFLSMLGFWMLFFLYPLNGTHHYVFSVIPMDAQLGAVLASALLGVNVIIVVTNLLLSARGSGWLQKDLPLRFAVMSTVLYLVVSIQGSLQAQMEFNQAIHFSDWVIGHAHLAMLGFATFAAAAGLTHAWQRIPDARFNSTALAWGYWLLLAGLLTMVGHLTAAGLVEAKLWQSAAPWLDSVRAVKNLWLVRLLTFVPITAGFISILVAITTGDKEPQPALRLSETGEPA
jgi:cbb3-type cytochrome oxidase subunit 1